MLLYSAIFQYTQRDLPQVDRVGFGAGKLTACGMTADVPYSKMADVVW